MATNNNEKKDVLSVTELTNKLKYIIYNNINSDITITGEISNLKISNNNNYFTLKDKESSISAIMWNNKLDFSDGDSVLVTGKLNIYNKGGCYNIIATTIKKVGLGDIYKSYEKKKQLYLKKGYFDDDNKKKIKNNINNIGIITAVNGAAIEDVMYVLEKNHFVGNIILKNCKVQGDKCATSIVNAIEYFSNKKSKVDLLLITRGGGSFEDLMGFSEDIVIEAIYKCPILTISAIGHEVDNMLSDYVADIRSPTPSIAAEVICKHQKYNIQYLYELLSNIKIIESSIDNSINNYSNILQQCYGQLNEIDTDKIIDEKINYLQNIIFDSDKLILEYLESMLKKLKNDLESINNGYILILDKNYNIIKTKDDFQEKYKKEKIIIMFGNEEVIIKN